VLSATAALSIVAGGLLHLVGEGAAGDDVWRAAVALLATELAFEVGRTVIVDHHMGVDTIALVAMVGSLPLGQQLAGVIVGLTFSGGAALEDVASTRARRELTALIQRAPKVAQLRIGDRLEQVPIADVQTGDVVVVRTGEVIPVDGSIVVGEAVVDTSTLSGEPLPVTIPAGMPVLSGSANAGAPFDVRANRPAADSAYAALVRLVEQAQADRAPFVRMADRYAGFFLPATLIIAGIAWALSGDAVRALAVVVVASYPMPADPRAADRARVRPVSRRALGCDREGRRSDRDAWPSAHRAVRQDGHAHSRDARGPRCRHPRKSPTRRAADACGLGRPDVGTRARRGARPRGRGRGP
jgi:cation transport ATPase